MLQPLLIILRRRIEQAETSSMGPYNVETETVDDGSAAYSVVATHSTITKAQRDPTSDEASDR